MDANYTSVIDSHDTFFEPTVTYDSVNGVVTNIARRALDEPRPSPVAHTYTSVGELLKSELTRRQTVSEEIRGRYKPKLAHVAYSHIPRANFCAEVKLDENQSLFVENRYFHRSPLNGKQYRDDEGNVHVVHHAITSSWDRSSDDLHMAKVLVNPETKKSICYGSRADSPDRAKKQAADIFRTEYKGAKKGLKKNGDGSYTLTYVVNSLTNPSKIQNPALLHERDSLEWERNALKGLTTIKVDGKTVHLKPIHVHHTLSVFGELAKILSDSMGGNDLEEEINKDGYAALFKYAESLDEPLIQDTLYFLQNRQNLSVSQRLILTDFLAQACNLPVVHHCKSVVDRTSIASTVAIMNHFIYNGKLLEFPQDEEGRFALHKLLELPEYRELFPSFLNISHQVSRDARVGILPDKTLVGRKALALNLKSGLLAATGAIPFFPDRALKATSLTKETISRYALLTTFYLLLPAIWITYYALLILATIPMACYFKKKSGSVQKEFMQNLYALPFHIKWHKIPHLNFDRTFNLDSHDINGEGRHLLVGATHIRDPKAKDPRFSLLPKHLTE